MFFSNCCWMKELAIWSQTGNSYTGIHKFSGCVCSLQVNANMKGLFKA